nr:Chain P, EH DOMAIN BINDING PROTEIN EPSIN [synthetic construct]
FSDPWGG